MPFKIGRIIRHHMNKKNRFTIVSGISQYIEMTRKRIDELNDLLKDVPLAELILGKIAIYAALGELVDCTTLKLNPSPYLDFNLRFYANQILIKN